MDNMLLLVSIWNIQAHYKHLDNMDKHHILDDTDFGRVRIRELTLACRSVRSRVGS